MFIVEQNRDGQLRSMLINECGLSPERLIAVLHYDGTPITARFITSEITRELLHGTAATGAQSASAG